MSIKIENITYMVLEADQNGEPVMNVTEKLEDNTTKVHGFSLTKGHQIFIANEFLRSLDFGIEIEFKDFAQYGMLIMECAEALEARNGVNA